MSDVRLRVLRVLKDFGFVGADNGLVPVEVDCSTGVLYAKKSWFGFGGYHLTNDFQAGIPTKCVKTLISVSGGSLPKLEDVWVELPSLELGDRWSVPLSTRINKYTLLPEEVVNVALITVHSVTSGSREVVLYALRSRTEVCVSKSVQDLVSVLKLYGANSKGRDDAHESVRERDGGRRDVRRDEGRRDVRRDGGRRDEGRRDEVRRDAGRRDGYDARGRGRR